ncbi:MAG: hypothetical protein Q8P00_01960 [Dehalococcoidia bacterium]|nr:hypothetical protein [Dehalococcoidia bacterium]
MRARFFEQDVEFLPLPRSAISFLDRFPYDKALYLLLTTSLVFAGFYHWFYDDPFITYRFAENLMHGLGFVYNPGQRVLSTTTPLFTILLALGGSLWSDLPHLAILLGAFGLGLGGLFLWELGRAWKTPVAGWTGLLLYPTFPLLLRVLGSEMPLAIAFCLGTLVFYVRQRYHLMAAFAALAILIRPDSVLVPIILASHYLLTIRRPIPWVSFALLDSLILPWFLFAWLYFGSPLPATLAAKQHQGTMAISQGFGHGLLTIAQGTLNDWEYWLEGLLAALGVLFMVRRARPWTIVVVWAVIYFLAYSVLAVSRYYWYYAPLVPAFIAMAGLGVASLKDLRSLTSRVTLFRTLAIVLLFLLAIGQLSDLRQLRQLPDDRFRVYRAIGEWLGSNSPSQATIGTLEVGIIGYYAERPMIDFAGLIQPDVAAQFTPNATYEDAALWAVAHYHPDYLVLHDKLFPRLEDGYVRQNCVPVRHFPGVLYGYSADMSVYACPRPGSKLPFQQDS